jgi:hypothetical protein
MTCWLRAMLVAFVPLLANAQSLRGTVVDTSGRPVRYATIRLFGDTVFSAPPLAQASTDSLGHFEFKAIPAGTHYVGTFRVGYVRTIRVLPAGAVNGDTLRIVMGEFERAKARRDSVNRVRHLERVALARSRPRHWRCTSGTKTAQARAAAAYQSFGPAAPAGMQRVTSEYGMPSEAAEFRRWFLEPLTDAECARFARGFDKQLSGLETDTVEVYRFGRVRFLPWLGGYEGGFADADGKILAIFIVPD